MVALSFFAGTDNIFNLFIKSHEPLEIATVFIWYGIGVLFIVFKNRMFFPFILSASLLIVLIDQYSYRSIGIFLLMIYVLQRSKVKRLLSFASIFLTAMVSYSMIGGNLIDVFALFIQWVFATFCYYGFIFLRVEDMGRTGKLIYTSEEREVLHALATQDKLQKEVAYELGLSNTELARMLAVIRRRNNIATTDMLLRLYAVEEFAEGRG